MALISWALDMCCYVVEKMRIALQRRSKEMQSVGKARQCIGKAWPRKGKAYQREAKEKHCEELHGLCVAMIA